MTASEFRQHFGEEADYWGEVPAYPVSDWISEVQDNDTRAGYWGWVIQKQESAENDEELSNE